MPIPSACATNVTLLKWGSLVIAVEMGSINHEFCEVSSASPRCSLTSTTLILSSWGMLAAACIHVTMYNSGARYLYAIHYITVGSDNSVDS